jgi:hypothetical protein
MFRLIKTLLLLMTLSAFAAGQGYVDILPDEIKNPFIERYKSLLDRQTATTQDEWAGTYTRYVAETWSDALVLDPSKEFAAFRDTCSNGPRAWVNFGSASFADGVLRLSPERKKGDEFVYDFPSTEFTAVRWGGEHWLVPSEKLTLFAHAVNSRSGHPYEIGYLKEDGPRKGDPQLPAAHLRYLSAPPISAKVIEIEAKPDAWFSRMTINVGSNRGVIEGMRFYLIGQKGVGMTIAVEEVRTQTSTARVTSLGQHGPALMKEIVPIVGWRFSNRQKLGDGMR